ncbi:MAG: YceI family protein [Candidatus Promineifilaceae bacterium]|nr:YceI family protein [Candidatus Promineifilaceae bacterium]
MKLYDILYWVLPTLLPIMLLLLPSSCATNQVSKIDPQTINGNEATASAFSVGKNRTLFEINPAESEARFFVDEILRGEEKTVVGKTNAVSGQIAVDFDDPRSSLAGPIQVNALTLETDNAFRNRALHTRILLATIYEHVIFEPTAVSGLPESITIGEPVEFQIVGDLTITAYTKPATFDVVAVLVSESRLEGQARSTIDRNEFDLVIPSAAGVAGVDEIVTLELDFSASRVEE